MGTLDDPRHPRHQPPPGSGVAPRDQSGDWLVVHRPGLRIQHVRFIQFELSGGHAGQESGDVDSPRSLGRPASDSPHGELAVQRDRNGGQSARGRNIRRQRHLRVLVRRQGSDDCRSRLRGRTRLELVDQVCGHRRPGHCQSARELHHADLHRDFVAAGTDAERLPASRVQRGRKRQEGPRRHHELDISGQRHRHELPVLAIRPHRAQPSGSPVSGERVPVRQRVDDRSVHRHHGQPVCEVPDDQHVPARRGDLLGQRVLGEDGLAAAHVAGRRGGSPGFAV